jgi:hypothetical protein
LRIRLAAQLEVAHRVARQPGRAAEAEAQDLGDGVRHQPAVARSRSICSGCSSSVIAEIIRPPSEVVSLPAPIRPVISHDDLVVAERSPRSWARIRSEIMSSPSARGARPPSAHPVGHLDEARRRPLGGLVGEREEAADRGLRQLAEARSSSPGRDAGDAADHRVRDRVREGFHQVDHAARLAQRRREALHRLAHLRLVALHGARRERAENSLRSRACSSGASRRSRCPRPSA